MCPHPGQARKHASKAERTRIDPDGILMGGEGIAFLIFETFILPFFLT